MVHSRSSWLNYRNPALKAIGLVAGLLLSGCIDHASMNRNTVGSRSWNIKEIIAQDTGSTDSPARGRRLGDYVPHGWAIMAKDSGDLNHDGLKDFVFLLEGPDSGSFQNPGEDDPESERYRPKALGILFGVSPGAGYRLAVMSHSIIGADRFMDATNSWGNMSLGIFHDTLSLSFWDERPGGKYEKSDFSFKYSGEEFRLVLAAEFRRNGRLDVELDTLNLTTGWRRIEDGSEREGNPNAPVVYVDTLRIDKPIFIDDFSERRWKGIRGFELE